MALFILKTRSYAGFYQARSSMGTRQGVKFTKWRTVGKYNTREEAENAPMDKTGLREYAIFHHGKKIA